MARVGRLATVDTHGLPHVVPVCFAVHGERVVSVVDDKPKRRVWLKRLDNVAATGVAELLVDHYADDDWTALWWVRLRGTGEVLTEGDEHALAVDLLVAKYEQYRARRPGGAVLAIAVDRVRHWEAAEPA